MLMSMLMREATAELDEERWDGLAADDLRVIEATTTEGVTVAEVSRRVGIPEDEGRAAVERLVASGHLEMTDHPSDRGRRVLHRTRSGQHVMARADLRIRQIEARWAQTVGAGGYRQFRTALEQLAVDHAGIVASGPERSATTSRERSDVSARDRGDSSGRSDAARREGVGRADSGTRDRPLASTRERSAVPRQAGVRSGDQTRSRT